MKDRKKSIPKIYHTILLSVASILYNYSVICVAATIIILIVFAIRREISIFEGATVENILTIAIGVVIFFPIRKLRKYLLEN